MNPQNEIARPQDVVGAGVLLPLAEMLKASGRYHAVCRDAQGNIKWEDDIENLIPDVGANNMLDNHLAGSAYTATWFMSLVDGASAPTYAAANTMASHAGWTESVAYSNATRPSMAFSAAAARSKATSAGVVFNINATATIAGAFVVSNSTKSGTAGVLNSVGNFTGGNKSVANGDSLTVTFTETLT